MVRLTLIARVQDGLPLAEGLDSEKDAEIDAYKSQAKSLLKKFSQQSSHQATRLSVESGKYTFHYLIDGGVCYLTLTEKGYPKKLAFQYLEELTNEFGRLYGQQVHTVSRPYAFIKFDTFIQKTKKLYLDTRTQRNMSKLNDDLAEVHSIMTRNIQEVLGQGEKLDSMAKMSSTLAAESKQYSSRAKDLHRQALIRKYVPLAVVVGVVLLLLWLRSKFYR
ncbi:SNAP receptor [Pleodorina starrii]|uniref:SNAP receptor n=1 Tax=Pleodorina starrii TaxID=330485 RepID=A0A9W6BSI2_9CHLO|nr:SNAP receptor [Pleodorina starrii]GLC57273.1 SNAP receptor [Pleodorina starrii]GLC71336.1 SNAP receptor [Pleodorina starrii]